jgi:tetratricopeptide (TPR) repeat protein
MSDRTRGSDARTTVGAPASVQCAEAAGLGLSDDQSLATCDRALNLERLDRRSRIATLVNRGTVHLRRRNGEAALADLEAVIALQPDHAEAHLNRGAALVMMRRPGPAVAAMTEALSLGVREPHKAYLNRGAAREELGDLRGALEDYRTALEIQPDWGPAGQELARFARGRRDTIAETLAADAAADAVGRTP